MNYLEKIKTVEAKLHKIPGITIHEFEVNKGADDTLLQSVEKAMMEDLPAQLTEFYRQQNGIKFSWSLKNNVENLFGFMNILPLEKAMFGLEENIEWKVREDRFKDILWNDDFDKVIITELKKHSLLEPFDGISESTTFLLDNSIRLFDVYEDEVRPYKVNFKDYMNAIMDWAGLVSIREHMLSTGHIPAKGFNKKTNFFLKLINPTL